jgi:flagellum-specific ATP synthase
MEPLGPAVWQAYLGQARQAVAAQTTLEVRGTLTRLAGLVLEASGLRMPVGSQCLVGMRAQQPILAEVVGFSQDRTFLMPAGDIHGLASGASVTPAAAFVPIPRLRDGPRDPSQRDVGLLQLPMGSGLLGRVVDAHGVPIDGLGALREVGARALDRRPVNAMERAPIRESLDTGIRAINALLTVGRGQRIGLFSGSGVGKSVLLGMMARYTSADVIVVGLIGERGREVKEFIEDILGDEGRERSVVVAAPADAPPMLRMQGAAYATAVAEHFRDQGRHVLLLMDSLTRYAMAQREIALAIGEPPATRGYPPSCFAKLPQLVERSGNGLHGVGSITAFYTVLTEADDQQDPIADAARAILDGHVVLSRALAESGHYPAIDIARSASRVMHNVVPAAHFELARRFRSIAAAYDRGHDLLQVGAYVGGSDPALDEAIRLRAPMNDFLRQNMHERATLASSLSGMQAIVDAGAVP